MNCAQAPRIITSLKLVRPDASNNAPPAGPLMKLPGAFARRRKPTFVARLVGPKTCTMIWGKRPMKPGATCSVSKYFWAEAGCYQVVGTMGSDPPGRAV